MRIQLPLPASASFFVRHDLAPAAHRGGAALICETDKKKLSLIFSTFIFRIYK